MTSRAGFKTALILAAIGVLAAVPARAEDPTDLNNRAVQEARAGRFQAAVELLRQARALVPTDGQVQKNLSGVLTDWAVELQEKGQFDQARAALEEACQHDSSNARALLLLGDLAHAAQDDLAAAVSLWKKALPGLPAAYRQSVLDRISQAERDLAIERGFQPVQTEHFQIRFEGEPDPQRSSALSGVLEREYGRLKAGMGSAPPSHLAVVVYAGGSFKRVAGRQDWAFGLYDGRIRLRLEDVGTKRMAPILSHELAHAFLREAFGPRIPIWVHEGYAQVAEPERPPTEREEQLRQRIASRSGWVPLKWLDRRFQQPSGREDIERAYAQSKWAVSRLLERFGQRKFRQFLERLKSGRPVEQAFDQTFAPLTWARVDAGNLD